MKQDLIKDIIQGMLSYLNNAQNDKLQEVLQYTLAKYEVTEKQNVEKNSEQNYVELFLSAKRIEGCSEKSLKYYKATIEAMLDELNKDVKHIETDDIRRYLTEYQESKKSSKVTIDNIRRILSSFFSWLEDEDYILKSPVRRIHRVKTGTNIKETYSDESLELMRDNCTEPRDLAIIDMLASTGMRVGEMCCLTETILILMRENVLCLVKAAKRGLFTLTQGQKYI
jgi:site-specific recombinase XerD